MEAGTDSTRLSHPLGDRYVPNFSYMYSMYFGVVFLYMKGLEETAPLLRAAPGRDPGPLRSASESSIYFIYSSYLTVCINTKPGARQAAHLVRAPCHYGSHN